MASFKVEKQVSTTYIDTVTGDPVQGFEVQATIYPWNEYVRIQVPSLAAEVVEPLLDEIIEQREALDALSEPPTEE